MRIEDLDTPRVVPGSAEAILRTLEACGLEWDGEVEYQSRHAARYEDALVRLAARGLTFPCTCSRRELAGQDGLAGREESVYPGTCRARPTRPGPAALRFRVDDAAVIGFADRIQGRQSFELRRLGDVVVRRRDGLTAYQLAVTVDDAAQGITDVVRGADLLASTAWQVAIGQALALPTPGFAHLPLVVEPGGRKLAKSRRSVPVDPLRSRAWLACTLRLLGQSPPPGLAAEPVRVQLDWAVRRWRLGPLRGLRTVEAPEADFAS